jgi:hypothetical protein
MKYLAIYWIWIDGTISIIIGPPTLEGTTCVPLDHYFFVVLENNS